MNFDYAEFKNRPFGRGGSYRYRKIGEGREQVGVNRHEGGVKGEMQSW